MKNSILKKVIPFSLVLALLLNLVVFAAPSPHVVTEQKCNDTFSNAMEEDIELNLCDLAPSIEATEVEHSKDSVPMKLAINKTEDENSCYYIVDDTYSLGLDTSEIQPYTATPREMKGIGTADSPLQISSAQELVWLSEKVWKGSEVSPGIQATDAHVILTQDINIRGYCFYIQGRENWENSWIPIGNQTRPFSGVFDGCGHTITGYYSKGNYTHNVHGLFGAVENATIKNVKMDRIKVDEQNSDYGSRLAGIVGYAKNSTIENCHVNGSVLGHDCLAGIVSKAIDTDISNCSADMTFTPVTPVNPNNYPMSSYYGGIGGDLINCTVKDCWANVNADRFYLYGGGIAGKIATSSMENCYSNVYIEGKGINVGGIVGGAVESSISHCFTLGHVGGNYNVAAVCGNATKTDIIDCVSLLSYLGGLTMGCFYYFDSPETYQGTVSGNKSYSLTTYYLPLRDCGTLVTPYTLATAEDYYYDIFTHEHNTWDSTQGGLPILSCLGQSQNSSLPSYLQEAINSTVISINYITPISVPFDTDKSILLELYLPDIATVVLGDKSNLNMSISWDLESYNPTLSWLRQTLTGTLSLPEGIINPECLQAEISIDILQRDDITLIEPRNIETRQNILLAPSDRTHAIDGVPTLEYLPDTVWARLSSNEVIELPVTWDTSTYDPISVGLQHCSGTVEIDPTLSIGNPDGIIADLNITVLPKEYLVVEAEEVSISALLGTDTDELNDILIREGKNEVDVWAVDEDFFDAYTFCNITIAQDQGMAYDMNTPGDYILTANMPENFLDFETSENKMLISVTVLEPSTIVKAEASMDYYQSAARTDLDNIPKQVAVTLENGYTILSNVAWDWETFDKNTVGQQIVLGTLIDLPAAAKHPEDQEIKAAMVVNVLPMQYEVTEISDNTFTHSAGLTLEELNAILNPAVTLNITSTNDELSFSTEYPINVTLEAGDSNFDPNIAQEYTVSGGFELPDNIIWPEGAANKIYLITTSVEIIEVDPLYAVANEGVEFDELELPSQVTATLSCIGVDGKNKKRIIDVDWGDGNGYASVPGDWNDDNTTTLIVTGSLANCPQFISNADDIPPIVYITMTKAPNLISINPSRFPLETSIDVKLGSTLEDIYTTLESHSVQLTLEDHLGNQTTTEMTFALRAEDNPHYDSMAKGTYTLNAYLPLGNIIRNPNGLQLQVVVKTVQYTIYSTKSIPLTRTVGTAFEDLDLPETATIVRNDKLTEELGVTWNAEKYNPTKLGNQIIVGTFDTPLPAHLTNLNNRQPKILLTLVNPETQILSLTPVLDEQQPMNITRLAMKQTDKGSGEDNLFGFTEYKFWAELQHKDGTISTELISIFKEVEKDCYE